MSDARTGHIELAAHANALAEAVRAGRAVPAGRLFGLPELPGDDYWLDMAGATADHRHPAEDHHQLAGPRRAGPQSLPRSAAASLPAVLARDRDHLVAGQRESRGCTCEHLLDQVSLHPRGIHRSRSDLAGRTPSWRSVLRRVHARAHVMTHHCPYMSTPYASDQAPGARPRFRAKCLNRLGSTPDALMPFSLTRRSAARTASGV